MKAIVRPANTRGVCIDHDMRKTTWFRALLAGALLPGCGASGFMSFTALAVTERESTSTWTQPLVSEIPADPGATDLRFAAVAGERSGHFRLLTYNVAGLPQLISASNPRANIPLMSPLLNHYDVAVVQEDFSYHAQLTAEAHHPYHSVPMRALSFVGDGLSQFSRFAFGPVHRVRWVRCNGFVSSSTDCLADKGFSFSEMHLAADVVVHLYNLHADAGSGELDVATRARNFEQLGTYISEHSAAQAILVAGDTNLRVSTPGDAATLATFLKVAELEDACAGRCGPDCIDRVFYRSSSRLTLNARRWWQDTRFLDAEGQNLSDHPAMSADFDWQRPAAAQRQLVAHVGEP